MRLDEVILRGLRSAQPAATTVPPGSLYCVTDELNAVERSNGTTWQVFGAAGGGDLSGPGATVMDDAIILWDGTSGALVKDSAITIAALITSAVSAGVTVYAPVPAEYNIGNSSGAKTVNWSNGNHQRIRLTGDVVFTFTNPVVGASYRLLIAQDGTGGRGVTWPADVAFEDGTPPVLDTTAAGITLTSLVYTATGAGGYLGFCTTRSLTL